MTQLIPETLVPATVLQAVTAEERAEAEAVYKTMSVPGYLSSPPVEAIFSSNPALWYLVLYSPMKYSVLSAKAVGDPELRAMLTFDSSRLDEFHKEFYSNRSHRQAAWEQRFDSTMAALGNPNIIGGTAAWMLDELIEQEPTDLAPEEIVMLFGDQLLDKWTPSNFNAAALHELLRLFELHGATEYLPKFKHWYRRASQASPTTGKL